MMTAMRYLLQTLVSCWLVAAPLGAQAVSDALPAKAKSPAQPAAKKKPPVPPATAEQIEAAQSVYYGAYECELQQSLAVATSARHPAYVDVTFGKRVYLMKPVQSATGAIRLEHTQGETLLVQIATKSMLLNVKTGQRMVDECIGATQRRAIEVAKPPASEAAAQQQVGPATEAASPPVAASAPVTANGASAPAAAASVPMTVPEAPLPSPASSAPSGSR